MELPLNSMNPKNVEFNEYMCRCECTVDGIKFWKKAIRYLQEVNFKFDGMLGGKMYFKTILKRDEVLKLMTHDGNWHVMRQSLETPDKYTGDRRRDVL